MESNSIENGKILVAEPRIMGDISFNRAVIILTEHSAEGSVGFILNKPLDLFLNDLLPEIDKDFPIFEGGPVEQDNLFYIHQMPNIIPNSIEIAHGLYWGGDFKVLKKLIDQDFIKESDIKFFLGYSGWEPHQLEAEIDHNTWILQTNEDKKEMIRKESEGYWKEKIEQMGGEYLLWANAPENPAYN